MIYTVSIKEAILNFGSFKIGPNISGIEEGVLL